MSEKHKPLVLNWDRIWNKHDTEVRENRPDGPDGHKALIAKIVDAELKRALKGERNHDL